MYDRLQDDLKTAINRYQCVSTAQESSPEVDIRSTFVTSGKGPENFQIWQQRMHPVYDLRPSDMDDIRFFKASITRYSVNDFSLLDVHTGPNIAERSLARISTESLQDISFSIFLEGRPAEMKGAQDTTSMPTLPGRINILATDMGQPGTIRSFEGRILLLFASRRLVEKTFPDPSALHGRRIQCDTPMLRLLTQRLLALHSDIGGMTRAIAHQAMAQTLDLVVAAFARQAGLLGNGQAAVRAALYAQARRHVDMHLSDPELGPDHLLSAMHLSRASVYRIFQQDGGLATYIRQRRLLMAARSLAHQPQLDVLSVAFSLGFNDASSFARAFRKAFAIAPRDFHQQTRHLRPLSPTSRI